ncbi:hypothetical protein [Streptococcus sp. S784/96/1]|uniref:hypothetical protein n=1 Tax=Streptococcus sp. S784/96/1 TaxID=2653499 RepID=UPI001389F038|nr:hypothetical protein [Streptococcus sp. S784/96/1]
MSGMWFLFVGLKKKQLTPSVVTKDGKTMNNYFIGFSDTSIPDIRQNNKIMSVLSVKYNTLDGYAVASTINDVKLREMILEEYDLKPKNVRVTFRQIAV